jgi:hypothetical protein
VFTYDRELRPVIDFGAARETWRPTLDRVKAPDFSEANFYDATIALLNRMTAIAGRRAIIVLTTGNDTFSRASFDDVVARARRGHIPIYCLTLDDVVRSRPIDISHGPLARVDWPRSAARLAQLARVSGGRVYNDVRSMSASAIYDDILERLRIQYVLTYVSPASGGVRSAFERWRDATTRMPALAPRQWSSSARARRTKRWWIPHAVAATTSNSECLVPNQSSSKSC